MHLVLKANKQIINCTLAQQIHVREKEITFIWSNEDVLTLNFQDEELAEKTFNKIISSLDGNRAILHV